MKDHNYKYYIFYTVNSLTKEGKELIAVMDLSHSYYYREFFKGFRTKASMLKWIDENNNAFDSYQMLKPIT